MVFGFQVLVILHSLTPVEKSYSCEYIFKLKAESKNIKNIRFLFLMAYYLHGYKFFSHVDQSV